MRAQLQFRHGTQIFLFRWRQPVETNLGKSFIQRPGETSQPLHRAVLALAHARQVQAWSKGGQRRQGTIFRKLLAGTLLQVLEVFVENKNQRNVG
ncbi:MAG: hypothetical protein LBO79_05820 [Zoogloeaceae bacterium]|nr:hypothetical protein [Zoogloeaceae bacterium]